MDDLLTRADEWQPLNLPDADIALLPALRVTEGALNMLIADTPWRQDDIVLFGKRMQQPRLHAWYGDPGASYTYSGLRNTPTPWTALLADIKARVEAVCGVAFNSVLLNLYRDHRDSMGAHSDDERALGPAPTIASLSLGATRAFVLKHRHRADIKPVRLALHNGSLLLMRGQTQVHWKHSVPKKTHFCAPRVNLTFRSIIG